MKNMNSHISSLFSSLNTGNTMFGSFNLGDYASIKNGSYGKLLKAHYAEEKRSATESAKTATAKSNVTSKKDNTPLSDVKKSADALKTSAEAFAKDDLFAVKDGEFDKEKILGAVKDFAGKYNATLDKTAKVNSKDVATSTKFMTSMTDMMSKALSKVGVNVGTDGKLSVDEEAFKKADMNRVKSLFGERISYGSQIADKASEISKDAVMNSNLYTQGAALSNTMTGLFDKLI